MLQERGAQLLPRPLRAQLDLAGGLLRLRLQLHLPVSIPQELLPKVSRAEVT